MFQSPTIRQIAENLGLGKSTVQRALTGQPGISEATRRRVSAAAEKMDYRPDPLYSMLGSQSRRGRSKELAIAYITRGPLPGRSVVVNKFLLLKLRGKELGYEVVPVDPSSVSKDKVFMDVLFHRGFVGAIIGHLRKPDHELILRNTRLPVICCGRLDGLPVHTVQSDTTVMLREVWRKLLDAGYTRIGAALGQHEPPVDDDFDRLGAFLAIQLSTLPAKHRIPPFLGGLHDNRGLNQWFRRYRPDAVLSFGNTYYYALKDSGVDMARVAFASLHAHDSPPDNNIAGIINSEEKVACEAVNLLDQFIRHRNIGTPSEPIRVLISGHWKDGPSLFPKKL